MNVPHTDKTSKCYNRRMAEVAYIGTTPDGEQFDASRVQPLGVTCLRCGWLGSRPMLKTIPYHPEDDYSIAGETEEVCPECESPAWEPME